MHQSKIIPGLTTVLFLLVRKISSFNPDYCVGSSDGKFINTVDCGTYYLCTGEATQLFYCPWGLTFEAAANRCKTGAYCPFTCPVPLPIPFAAQISNPPTPGPFDTATYTCSPGYRLIGNPTRSCRPDGSWTGSEPTCIRVADGIPRPLVMKGTRHKPGHRFGGVVIGMYNDIYTPTKCADLCQSTPPCVAANFFKPDLFQCELLTTKPFDYSQLDVTPDFDFIELLN